MNLGMDTLEPDRETLSEMITTAIKKKKFEYKYRSAVNNLSKFKTKLYPAFLEFVRWWDLSAHLNESKFNKTTYLEVIPSLELEQLLEGKTHNGIVIEGKAVDIANLTKFYGGDQSEVYLMNKDRILKIYDMKQTGETAFEGESILELKALRLLKGTGLAPELYDAWYDIDNKKVCIVMEYVSCRTKGSENLQLSTLFNYLKLPVSTRLSNQDVKRRVTDLIQNLHDHGVYHTDMHYKNVLVLCKNNNTTDVTFKAVDFGNCFLTGENTELKKLDSRLLTFTTTAPPVLHRCFRNLNATQVVWLSLIYDIFKKVTRGLNKPDLEKYTLAKFKQRTESPSYIYRNPVYP
jgi:tRNA A-37 threonylcarbamoyl transferase component Bud32